MKYKKLVIAFVVGLLSTIIVISCSGDGDNGIVSGGSDDNTISGTYKRVL